MRLFGSSGTRGVAISELSPAFVLKLAQGAGSVWNSDRAAVARDTRTTGEMFAEAATAGLTAVGCDVDRLGAIPTPAACAHAERHNIPCVMITASHNPAEFNGIKLIGSDGVELGVNTLKRIEDRVLAEEFTNADWQTVGAVTGTDGVAGAYVDNLLSAVDRDRIEQAGLTVALDPGHGAGARSSPEFFRRLGCEVVTVNAQPDGHFPGRQPEPVPKNLNELGELVRSSDADIGIAHDGDADRAVFFDESGEYIEGDASLAALAAAELEPGDTTVAAVNVSQRLVDVCDARNARLELTAIGATNIITRIRELWTTGERIPIAGEGNGGVFFPQYRLTRDGAYVGAKFLELIADSPASDVVEPFTEYHNVRRNLTYESESELDTMLTASREHVHQADAEPDTTDGYRLDYEDAWVLVRPSGTEPKVRIYSESREKGRAESLVTDISNRLEEALADHKSMN